MMKRLLLLACAASLMLAGGAQAQTVTVDGITYSISVEYQKAWIEGADPDIATANIPATVAYGGKDYPVKEIGSCSFEDCAMLETVVLPQGMTDIYESAFQNCTALENVSLPVGLEYISDQVFYGCTSLESLVLPEGLRKTCWLAFSNCPSLKTISFPSTFQEMEGPTFYNTPLEHVICHAVTPPAIMDSDFDAETYATATLHVPAGAVDAYKAAEGWKNFLAVEGDASVGISNVSAASQAAVYADGVVTATGLVDITVYAQNGAQALHADGVASLSLEGLPRGIYLINVEQGGQHQVLKVMR